MCLGAEQVRVVEGDITRLAVDAIVNAANGTLLGGGGVDGAIHRAAGPDLVRECRCLGGCETGQAKITYGYDLPASFIIHTVGPVWTSHAPEDARDLLASCYENALDLADEREFGSIAFPAISTGVYGYPLDKAAAVATGTVLSWLADKDSALEVTFCCFSEESARFHVNAIWGTDSIGLRRDDLRSYQVPR